MWVRKAVMIVAALVLGAPWAVAHQGATGAVKQRMEFMESMGKAMKGLGDMLQGKRAFDLAEARAHARTLQEHTLVILEQFPEGSTQHPSEALPIIWEEWPAFEEVALRSQDESGELRAILEDGAEPQAVLDQYVALGKACSACHDRYRKPNS